MFRKFLPALALVLAASSTFAQNTTCPTRPTGDNSNACASTAFVNNEIAAVGLNLVIGTTPIVGGTNRGLLYDNAGFLGNLSTIPNGILGTNAVGTPSITISQPLIAQATNPANAGLAFNLPYPVATGVNNGIQISVGTAIPATQQFGANNAAFGVTQAVVGSVSIPVGDTTTLQGVGVAGYSITNSPSTGHGATSVGLFAQGSTSVANANIISGNSVAQNTNGNASVVGFDIAYINPFEFDLNLWQTAGGIDPVVGQAIGLVITGSSNLAARVTNSAAIKINRLSVNTNIPWDYGFTTYAGAVVNIVAAAPAGIGASQNSAKYVYQSTNGASTILTASSYSDTTGAINFDSNIKLTVFSVAGVVTNTSAGLLVSTTTLPTGLTAPAFTVTGSFTAIGLVTNADLVNASTTVNGQTCTLGSTCTITAAAASIAVGTTTIISGTTTRVLFDNAGVLGEYTISGTGNVAMTTNAVFTTPNLGTPSAAVLTNASGLPTTALTGFLQAAQEPAHTGDVTNTAGSLTLTIANNAVTLAKLATQATNTVLGNATSGSAVPTALTVASCSTASSALIWTTNTGFGCNTSITAGAVPASGLTGTTLASNVVSSSLTSVGTIATGVWQGTVVGATYGGTGVNNGSSTITLAGSLVQVGAFTTTITATATTNSTLPSGTHTLAGLDVAQVFTALQTITVAGSNQLFIKSIGANASFINIDTGGVSQQAGFNLSDNGTLAWQFIKQTNEHFLIFDSANALTAVEITPGATTAGFTAFGYTKAATATNAASVTIAGGLGVAGKGYFGAAINLMNFTVATLPTGVRGDIAYVTDAVACTFLGAITGGAATVCPVFYNGTAWIGG